MANDYNSSLGVEEDSKGYCTCCGRIDDAYHHKQTERHKFNFHLWEFKNYRKAASKDKHGIEITVTTNNMLAAQPLNIEQNTKKGEYTSELTEAEMATQESGITYIFTITARKPAVLMLCHLLPVYPGFDAGYTLRDCMGLLSTDHYPQLEKDASYTIELNFNSRNIGDYPMPIAFRFQTTNHKDSFSIVKEMVIKVIGERDINKPEITKVLKKSPFTNKAWAGNFVIVPANNSYTILNNYDIPREIHHALICGLKYYNGMADQTKMMTDIIRQYMKDKQPTRANYKQYFHHLLWLDEAGAEIKIGRYNMENVSVTLQPNSSIVELIVPGLAEKRPSLIRGDTVCMRVHDAMVIYHGIVKEVRDKDITIKNFSPEFINFILHNPQVEYDVQFKISRLVYERQHRAVDLCSMEHKLDVLFPNEEKNKANKTIKIKLTRNQFKNTDICSNTEQQEAVVNIVNASSGNAPYIVFGPPGTGKTVTIVEAIIHIVNRIPTSNVLVCAPANAACDMLTLKLAKYFRTNQLIRVHSDTVDMKAIPDDVKKYSNQEREDLKTITGSKLQEFRIVVTTLMSAGRFSGGFSATHVFIDEAAQAVEPEAIIPLGGVLKPGGLFVLAGDPKQLGPLCNSDQAEHWGFGKSLLSRLMDLPLYRNTNRDSKYFITKLLQNYRNHPDILDLPNKLFYESELKPVSDFPIKDAINKVILPVTTYTNKKFKAQAVEFYGVNGKESREGRSPSYYNQREIEVVMNYIRALTNVNAAIVVQPEEIGVVVPYIRQMYRIRGRLQGYLEKVEVGTTETFQGREKRVMIISTVRAQASLLLHDERYKIGFVGSPERFNVAITRAISKLIVIGNPQVLNFDKNWLKLIEFCREKYSYRGFYIAQRNETIRSAILSNVKKVDYKKSGEN